MHAGLSKEKNQKIIAHMIPIAPVKERKKKIIQSNLIPITHVKKRSKLKAFIKFLATVKLHQATFLV